MNSQIGLVFPSINMSFSPFRPMHHLLKAFFNDPLFYPICVHVFPSLIMKGLFLEAAVASFVTLQNHPHGTIQALQRVSFFGGIIKGFEEKKPGVKSCYFSSNGGFKKFKGFFFSRASCNYKICQVHRAEREVFLAFTKFLVSRLSRRRTWGELSFIHYARESISNTCFVPHSHFTTLTLPPSSLSLELVLSFFFSTAQYFTCYLASSFSLSLSLSQRYWKHLLFRSWC